MEQISYYNCTNYYFEIEQEDGDRIPLAFSLLLDCDKFIYCSDAGLASKDNFALNPTEQRAFIASEDQTCR